MTTTTIPLPAADRPGRWFGGPMARVAVLLPLAVAVFVRWVDAVSALEAHLAAWLLGDAAQSPGRAMILFPNVERSDTFVLRVTASCSVLTMLLAVGAVSLLVRAPWWRRLLGALAGAAVAVVANQVRICGIGLVRRTWGRQAFFVAHEWAGTLLTLLAIALSIAVAVWVATRGSRTGHDRPGGSHAGPAPA